MPPVGDERDQDSSREWGLGEPITGDFGRTRIQELLVVVVPVPLVLGLFALLFPRFFDQDWSWVLVGSILGGIVPIFGALSVRNPGGVADIVQVGSKGVAVGRRSLFGHALLRDGWILWEQLRLDPVGVGDRWARSIHAYIGEDDGAPHLIDYRQAREILVHPKSQGALTDYPAWLEAQIGIPAGSLSVRPWGASPVRAHARFE